MRGSRRVPIIAAMSIRNRLSSAVALLVALAALVALLGAGSAGALPKIPKAPTVVQRKVAISASGTLTYRWTYDNRARCTPGYSKTVEEELRFNFPARRTKMAIAIGRLAMPALRGGSSSLEVRLGGWNTSNYCPPHEKIPDPVQPTCRSGDSPLVLAITSTAKDLPLGEDELAPLSRESQITIGRSKGLPQNGGCLDQRPDIPFEYEDELGWFADPRAGAATGMNAPVSAYGMLTKGKTLRRQIQISGGCGSATAHASDTKAIPPEITKCTLDGVIFVKVTGLG
jgi:hypothetical protein